MEEATTIYRVLLAEDNIVNQKVASKMLEKLGCRVDVAANGEEAVELLRLCTYDVVFMDCQMPVLDGFGATAKIRRLEKGKERQTPIVAMTANAMAGDRQACLDAGMDDYVAKPINVPELQRVLSEWVAAAVDAVEGGSGERKVDPKIFDQASFLERLGGDEELCDEILGLYLEDVPRRIGALEDALDNSDAELVYREAHTIKGSSANVGAVAMEKAAKQVELAGKNVDLDQARERFSLLSEELRSLERALTGAGIYPQGENR